MALTALAGVLASNGAKELAKNLGKPIVGGFLNHISEKIGIPVGDPEFDAEAARYAQEHMEEMHRHEEALFGKAVEDKQDARKHTFQLRERLSIEHQQWTDRMNLLESIFMSAGGLIFLLTSIVALVWFESKTPDKDDIPDWLQSLIIVVVTWISKDLISLRAQYKWGTSHSSSTKNDTITKALEREQADDIPEVIERRRVVPEISTQRRRDPEPPTPQPIVAPPVTDPLAPDMDEIDDLDKMETVESLLDTERRPTEDS